MIRESKRIPMPVVQRLTKYLAYAQAAREEGAEWISSHQIAKSLGLTSSTVRQDLSHVDVTGTARRGYETKRLEWVLYKELGADRITNMVIVGAGKLGQALAGYGGFVRNGFSVRGVFDVSPRRIGKRIGDLVVESVDDMARSIAGRKIDIGILTVPGSAAQEVAEALTAAGVGGVLNLTGVHVHLPASTRVVDVRMIASLQELLYLMKTPGPAGGRKNISSRT